MRKAQMWSLDFILSLVIFTVAIVVSYTMVNNTLSDNSFEQVSSQAKTAAGFLATEGHPEHFNEADVIRAGLVSGNRLSYRKALEIGKLNTSVLRQALRLTDNYYVYLTNGSNITIPLFGDCGTGDISQTKTANYTIISSVAFAEQDSTVAGNTSINIISNDSALLEIERADVIVFEGDITGLTGETNDELKLWMDQISEQGKIIYILGYPGTGIFGINKNTTSIETLEVQGDAGDIFNLTFDEILNVSRGGPVQIDRIFQPNATEVSGFRAIANAGSRHAIAEWKYKDSQIYYFATVDIIRQDGSNMTNEIAGLIQNQINVSWPSCEEPEIPTNSEQIGKYPRAIVYHDDVLTANVLVWRYG